MKKRDVIVNAAADFVFILLACIFAGIFSSMGVKLSNKFVELGFMASAIVAIIFQLGFSVFFTAFFSYKNGYHVACFDKKEVIPSALIASAMHFVIAFITLFSPWVSGATRHISGFIAYGDNYVSLHQMLTIPVLILALVGVGFALVYAGLIVLGAHLGVKKRLEDRAELLGEKSEEEK